MEATVIFCLFLYIFSNIPAEMLNVELEAQNFVMQQSGERL